MSSSTSELLQQLIITRRRRKKGSKWSQTVQRNLWYISYCWPPKKTLRQPNLRRLMKKQSALKLFLLWELLPSQKRRLMWLYLWSGQNRLTGLIRYYPFSRSFLSCLYILLRSRALRGPLLSHILISVSRHLSRHSSFPYFIDVLFVSGWIRLSSLSVSPSVYTFRRKHKAPYIEVAHH